MGIEAIYPKRRTSQPGPGHKIYPYLLRGLAVTRPDQVWAADITYVPLAHGFMYLVAVMDWYSRYVLSWQLSNSLEGSFCVEALDAALACGRPEIFNTDQGAQFTSQAFTSRLEAHGVAVSMDGRGRALDNVFVERLWRSVKYEDIYLRDYATPPELRRGLDRYFAFYGRERLHQALDYLTPWEAYRGKRQTSIKASDFVPFCRKNLGAHLGKPPELPLSGRARPSKGSHGPLGQRAKTRIKP
jgi:putative transposase